MDWMASAPCAVCIGWCSAAGAGSICSMGRRQVPLGAQEENDKHSWRNFLRMTALAQPADLELLADSCESLAADQQRWGLAQVLQLLGGTVPGAVPAERTDPQAKALWAGLLADSGAFESAAVALLPEGASYTCGRLGDGSYIAQVVLAGGCGANSRGARALSLAIVAALLRALGRDVPQDATAN